MSEFVSHMVTFSIPHLVVHLVLVRRITFIFAFICLETDTLLFFLCQFCLVFPEYFIKTLAVVWIAVAADHHDYEKQESAINEEDPEKHFLFLHLFGVLIDNCVVFIFMGTRLVSDGVVYLGGKAIVEGEVPCGMVRALNYVYEIVF